MQRRHVGILLLIVLVFGSIAVTVQGGSEYAVWVDTGIDTPDDTIELEGETYEVTGIAEVSKGEELPVSVRMPDDDSYRLYTYNSEKTQYDTQYVFEGDDPDPFPTEEYEPGLYTLALYADGDYQAVYPFVISGADVSVSAPDTATQDDKISVTASVDPTYDVVSIEGVEMVLFGEGISERKEADRTGEGYSTTFDLSEIGTGDYSIYAVATNDSTTANGENEIIAISEENEITITESSSTTSSPDGVGGGLSSTTPTQTNEPTTTYQTTSRNSTTNTTGPTKTNTSTTSQTSTVVTTMPPTTSSSVITPQSGTTVTTSTGVTETTTPNFPSGVFGALTILVLLFLLANRSP